MTYTPIYCNKESIGRKLKARLNIKPSQYQSAPYSSLPSNEVDDVLVDEVIEQQEEFLNLILNQIYELPLINNHSILTTIVDDLVIAELLRIHFIGTGMAQLGGDVAGTSTDTKLHAYSLLAMLTTGHNIYIPGMPLVATNVGVAQPQPIRLTGEVNRSSYDDTITRLEVYVTTRPKLAALRNVEFINETGKGDIYW